MAEEILTSLRRTNSGNFGAGEGHHELPDLSIKHDVVDDYDLPKGEAVQDKTNSSMWSSLTRVFRFGLSSGPGADLQDISSTQAEQLTTHSKRGSLGKFFRHGFGHSVPTTTKDSDINSSAAFKDIVPPQNKRGSLARLFKQSKPINLEENNDKELENFDVHREKKETRKHPITKMWRHTFRSDSRKCGPDDFLPNTEPLYSSGPEVTLPEYKRLSLGQMFRRRQNNDAKETGHT